MPSDPEDAEQPECDISRPRILVVGVTGSGKTTVARHLAGLFHVPHIELDALYWEPNWTPALPEKFRRRISAATACDAWVVDGNYSVSHDITWTKATMLVWIDYSLPLIMWRLWWRVLRRGLRREVLWNGNRDRLWTHFFSRNSLFLWALQTHGRIRATYPLEFRQPEYAHLQVVHLGSPSETRTWLDSLTALASEDCSSLP